MTPLRIAVDPEGQPGIVTGHGFVRAGTGSLKELIERFDVLRSGLARLQGGDTTASAGDRPRLLAPLAHPAKVLATMRARTAGPQSPAELHLYVKANSSVAGDDAEIVLPDAPGAALFTHNACLAVVIGRRARSLDPAGWRPAVFGYTAMIDVVARTDGAARWKDGRSCLGGSFDGSAPLGPWIVPRDEADDAAGVPVRLRVNGEVRQQYRLGDLDRDVGEALALASAVMTLHPGDVVAIQGPAEDQGPVQGGDRIELDVGPVGRLTATVADPLGRRWPSELRLDASCDDTDVRPLVQ